MASSYVEANDPVRGIPLGTLTRGKKVRAITAGAADITLGGQYPAYVVAYGTGTVSYIGYKDDDSADAVTDDVNGRFVIEGFVRRVTATTGTIALRAWFL